MSLIQAATLMSIVSSVDSENTVGESKLQKPQNFSRHVKIFDHEIAVDTSSLILIRRATHSIHHAGEMALPGGIVEPTDVDLRATALREAYEEIGLLHHQVNVVGSLSEVHTMATPFVVTPFVGLVSAPVRFTMQTNEVAEIVSLPLPNLLDDNNYKTEIIFTKHGSLSTRVLKYKDYVIWGATLRMLNNFVDALEWP